jgi:hypothetical protein
MVTRQAMLLTSLTVVPYSDVEGCHEGVVNIDADPLFAGSVNGPLHFRPGSPCVDEDYESAPHLPDVDTDVDGDRDLDLLLDFHTADLVGRQLGVA